MISGILIAAAIVGGTGLFIGVFLGVSGKKFAVEVDEREEAILAELPGNNCGGCGYAGCSGLAAAIVKGEAEDRSNHGTERRKSGTKGCICEMCRNLRECIKCI